MEYRVLFLPRSLLLCRPRLLPPTLPAQVPSALALGLRDSRLAATRQGQKRSCLA